MSHWKFAPCSLVFLPLVIAVGAATACGGTGDEAAKPGPAFAACKADSDCEPELFCAQAGRIKGHCARSCTKDSECKTRYGEAHACGDSVCIEVCGWLKYGCNKPSYSSWSSCGDGLTCRGEDSESCASQCTVASWGREERDMGLWDKWEEQDVWPPGLGGTVGALGGGGTPGAGSVLDGGAGGTTGAGTVLPDAGKADAGVDAGTDAGTVQCGGQTCSPFRSSFQTIAAGCARDEKDAEVCGLANPNPSALAPAFIQRDAPGVASSSCAAALEQAEAADAGTRGNQRLDYPLKVGALTLAQSVPTCCTAAGRCSVDTAKGQVTLSPGAAPTPNAQGFGCIDPAWVPVAAPYSTACDPVTGVRASQ